jgi:hypothetical protein
MKNICSLYKLIGKKVLSVRSYRERDCFTRRINRRKYGFEPKYILFSDKESIIRLEEQNSSYHDCAGSARHIIIDKNKNEWKRIFEDNYNYPVADMDI